MKINIKEKKQDKWLLWTVVFLVALGLPMLLIASSPEVGYSYFLRQAAKLVPGVLILLFMSYFNYRHLQKLAWFLMGTSFLLLLYTKLGEILDGFPLDQSHFKLPILPDSQ
ncbi:MAG: hypothetical protein Ct9H300mP24_2150 [Candidatus Neomarinimicrobiota bacterium]|nr:MAG: hypothetical protein Ct9H300mP24_2150 [Candidatus Neomarinimicrobiota bacterium]